MVHVKGRLFDFLGGGEVEDFVNTRKYSTQINKEDRQKVVHNVELIELAFEYYRKSIFQNLPIPQLPQVFM